MQLEELIKSLHEEGLLRDIVATAALFAGILILRSAAHRTIRRVKSVPEEQRLRWRVQTRYVLLGIFALGLILIWGAELQALALSMVAVALAIVIATKELLLCVLGGFMRQSTGAFHVGDRIEVNGIKGDVIDTGVLTTTLLEVGPAFERNGRAIVLSNATFLSSSVLVETFEDNFVLHAIRVPLRPEWDWRVAEQALLAAATQESKQFVSTARTSMTAVAMRYGLISGSLSGGSAVEPLVLVNTNDVGGIVLTVRLPSTARSKGMIEQNVLRGFLDRMEGRTAASEPVEENAVPFSSASHPGL